MELSQLEQRLKSLPSVSEIRGYGSSDLEALSSEVSRLGSDIEKELARQEALYKNVEEEEKTLKKKIKDEFGCDSAEELQVLKEKMFSEMEILLNKARGSENNSIQGVL